MMQRLTDNMIGCRSLPRIEYILLQFTTFISDNFRLKINNKIGPLLYLLIQMKVCQSEHSRKYTKATGQRDKATALLHTGITTNMAATSGWKWR